MFRPISFTLNPGELLVLTGQNGIGKSSLLRVIATLALPYHGELRWQDQPVATHAALYRQTLHFLSHQNGLKLGLTTSENIALMYRLQDVSVRIVNGVDSDSYQDWLQRFQLEKKRNTITRYLSAGQKRKLALLKCVLFNKPLWLLDEPLASLDQDSQETFLLALKSHLQMGGLAIISSHQRETFFDTVTKQIKQLVLHPC